MRFYDIALFLFIFNLVLGVIPSLIAIDAGIKSISGFDESTIRTGVESAHLKINTAYTPVLSELNWFVENVRLVVQGLSVIATAFFGATIALPVMLNLLMCNVPGACGALNIHPFSALMGAMILFVYFVGIIQFMTGRSYKEAA